MPETHTVVQGECLLTLAQKYGFGDIGPIYEANEQLKERKNPYVLAPGEEITIPDRAPDSKPLPVSKDRAYTRFQLRAVPSVVRLHLQDSGGKPMVGLRYTLAIGEADPLEGTTGEGGLVEQPGPPDAEEATLKVWPGGDSEAPFTWTLKLGHLDPVSTDAGVQARLINLGFDCSAELGQGLEGTVTKAKLEAFQTLAGLDPADGVITDATRRKLVELHDGSADDDLS